MTKKEIELLDDEELRALSLQKKRNGCYSREANLAMAERNRRSSALCCTDFYFEDACADYETMLALEQGYVVPGKRLKKQKLIRKGEAT